LSPDRIKLGDFIRFDQMTFTKEAKARWSCAVGKNGELNSGSLLAAKAGPGREQGPRPWRDGIIAGPT
jgi:hypothetical protein